MSDGRLHDRDLAALPAPAAVEALDYEALLSACKEELQQRIPELNMAVLPESDPISKVLEVLAYRELLIRQTLNEAVRGSYLALANGPDLNRLLSLMQVGAGASEAGSMRIPPVFNSVHTAGSKSAYLHLAGKFASDRAADIAVHMDSLGEILITLLPTMLPLHQGTLSGQAAGAGRISLIGARGETDRLPAQEKGVFDSESPRPEDMLQRVHDRGGWSSLINEQTLGETTRAAALEQQRREMEEKFLDDETRPITHKVTVSLADINYYEIKARIGLDRKPGSEQVLGAVAAAVVAYTQKNYRLGMPVLKSGLLAAFQQPGVRYILLETPAADELPGKPQQANFCPYIDIRINQQVPVSTVTELQVEPKNSEQDISIFQLKFRRVENETLLTHYIVYWGDKNQKRLAGSYPLATVPVGGPGAPDGGEGSDNSVYRYHEFDYSAKPVGAEYLLVYTANENGEALENAPVGL
ncbi:hypothetical protein FKG94_17925 [Exilibacterium tricleocarpae]|uniref:Baseplate protein J-like domain-containing protein n=1 Tax=Exilibacterium tricleocarpae TaxID=2591008 RepID=A0A545T5S2_9GAMM|nr:baseplate J/gp47 family protein [Exilibacterium tricleocarpae]TQV72581.1 hypothetical protein FKG94_17925 [Exilibacterium tricleocarpae]